MDSSQGVGTRELGVYRNLACGICADALKARAGGVYRRAPALGHGASRVLRGEIRVGLMVRWVGGTYDVLPPAGLVRALEILEGLHRLGVVHGDVACRSMSYDPMTGRVVLFGFSEGGTPGWL
jgi:hypothetical protein